MDNGVCAARLSSATYGHRAPKSVKINIFALALTSSACRLARVAYLRESYSALIDARY